MRLRYLVEYVTRGHEAPRVKPAGVWVQGFAPGIDLSFGFLPGFEAAEREAHDALTRLVQARLTAIPSDTLEILQASISPYRGVRGPITSTEGYGSHDALIAAVLTALKAGGALPGHETEQP